MSHDALSHATANLPTPRLEQTPKLLLGQPYVLDDLFEERSGDVAWVHRNSSEHLAADRIGEIAVATLLMARDEAGMFKRSGYLGCRTRRQSAAHAVAGTSSVTPRETPRTGRLSTGIFLPALARASR